MTHPVPSCITCASCAVPTSGRIVEAVCTLVVEPIGGTPQPLKIARLEEWGGWTLPCGYSGALWSAKS